MANAAPTTAERPASVRPMVIAVPSMAGVDQETTLAAIWLATLGTVHATQFLKHRQSHRMEHAASTASLVQHALALPLAIAVAGMANAELARRIALLRTAIRTLATAQWFLRTAPVALPVLLLAHPALDLDLETVVPSMVIVVTRVYIADRDVSRVLVLVHS
jgi:hypothetical protein